MDHGSDSSARWIPMEHSHPTLDSRQHQSGERCWIQSLVQGQQAVAPFLRVSTNKKICKNAPRATIALLPPPACILLKRLGGKPPNTLIEIPLDSNASVVQERINECRVARGECQ